MILPDQIHSKQSKDLIKKKVRTAFRAVKLRGRKGKLVKPAPSTRSKNKTKQIHVSVGKKKGGRWSLKISALPKASIKKV